MTTLTLGATPTTVAWGKPWTLSGALSAVGGGAVPDAPVNLMQSVGGGAWTLVSTLTPAAGTSTYTGSIGRADAEDHVQARLRGSGRLRRGRSAALSP